MARAIRGSGREIPPDILGEIFQCCLPSDPLDHQQPDVTFGPMLLCQICSYWRSVALNSPLIWKHLYHVSKITVYVEGVRALRYTDIEFLRWWQSNIGPSLAPFLRLSLDMSPLDLPFEVMLDDYEQHAFVVEFMSSAEYLEVNMFIYPDTWFSFIRQCTSLELGDFTVFVNSAKFSMPAQVTLPTLRQVAIHTKGVTIPALRLDVCGPLSVVEINNTLQSTPNLKELQLGPDFPRDPVAAQIFFPGPDEKIATPLGRIAPDLQYIHFYDPRTRIIFSK
ncbi:hypothetical protein CPB84DRAFT_1852777 [Gymnopilus junonius]|uniref:F-box domain-containing protein n=1 Tax=Gymnopilus junonius TaxID=109634 RepID=A0A9P5THX1_GYMJU|nr:hypothetical protein CPB84DRAFT_1852777 [Gymnopilus junonius]